jgi:hypothetical protein
MPQAFNQIVGQAVNRAPHPTLPYSSNGGTNQILLDILRENKGMGNVFSPENTSIIFSNPERTSKAGRRQLEYWPPSETGTPGFPRPEGYSGKHILEVYSEFLRKNPQFLKQAVYGDMLHGLGDEDKKFALLRNQFTQNYTPTTQHMISRLLQQGDNRRSIDDMYIRGWISPDARDEFRKAQASGENRYSPQQLKILQDIQNYVKTGK